MSAAACHYQLHDLDRVHSTARMLAEYFQQPAEVVCAIHELLLNAVEHGNLGIGFAMKTTLMRRGLWQKEILRRQQLPENLGKTVDIAVAQHDAKCTLIIADQGRGFPWQQFIHQTPCLRSPSGRGLQIVFNSGFEMISFNPEGNKVTCMGAAAAPPAFAKSRPASSARPIYSVT